MDDLRTALLAAFEAELAEHLEAVRAALSDAAAGRAVDWRDASRRAHSLKGAARAVEQPETEALAHEAEELLLGIETGERSADAPIIAELRRLFDRIEDAAGGKQAPDATDPPDAPAPADRLRVDAAHLERLSRALGDLAMQAQQGAGLETALADLQAELAAMVPLAERSGAGDLALRLTRAGRELTRLRGDAGARRDQLDRSVVGIERDAERLLLSPVATLFDGHERMVREIAEAEGKTAELVVEAGTADADRRILAVLREPVLHLLRNAVAHGIELPAERNAAGKPAGGTVKAAAAVEAGRLNVSITDDGRGFDDAAIERRARAIGLIPAGAPRPRPRQLRAMVFAQGFSTASSVDRLSGRGLGLSVVAEAARRLHGHVDILPGPGAGTRIVLSVPAALTRQPLVFVEAGGDRLAVPASGVDRMLRVPRAAVERGDGGEVFVIDGAAVPLASLSALIGGQGAEPGDRTDLSVLLLHAGDDKVGIVADALLDVRAAIVGDPTAILADAPLVLGTVVADGVPVIVLDPAALASAAVDAGGAHGLAAGEAAATVQRTILVVDDSITTRTLERTILEGQGYRVLVDVDGLAGLERLRSGIDAIDLVVADVEMPRMDGFALLSAIRNDPLLGTLPVVMMTSRNSPDDIERGLSLGANAYVTKQEFDQGGLIAVVQQLI